MAATFYELSGWLGHELINFKIVATANLINNSAILVEENFGYAITLDNIINTTGDSEICFRPLHPAIEAPLHLVWRKNIALSPAATKFLEVFRAQIETENIE